MVQLVGFVSQEPHKHDAEKRKQLVQTRLQYCDVGVWRPIKKFKAAGDINFQQHCTDKHSGFIEHIVWGQKDKKKNTFILQGCVMLHEGVKAKTCNGILFK